MRSRRAVWFGTLLGAAGLVLVTTGCGAGGEGDAAPTSVDAAQDGAPGELTPETTVPETSPMPDLVGLTEDEARAELAALGVTERDVDVETQESMEPSGTVIQQVPREGADITGAVSLVVAARVREVPDFVGVDIDEVTEWATDRGIVVVQSEVLDDDRPSGEVVSTKPAAGEAPASELVVEVVVAPVARAVAGMEPVSECRNFSTGNADVGGTTYPDSLTLPPGIYRPAICTMEYNLRREWTRFRAVAGLSDVTPTGYMMKVVVSVDGAELFNETMPVGVVRELDLDVSDMLRLILSVELIEGSMTSDVAAVFGNARVTAPPSLIQGDESTPSDVGG